jgi:hypothetical protein
VLTGRRRCAMIGIAWLIPAATACVLLPFEWASWCALALIALTPVAFGLCLANVIGRMAWWLSVLIPVVIVAAYAIIDSEPTAPGMNELAWIGLGIIAWLGVLLLQGEFSTKVTGLHRYLLVLLGLVWWTGWGMGIANPHKGCVLTTEMACKSNLKKIGGAYREYRDRFNRPPAGLEQLAKASILRIDSKCPTGRRLELTSAWHRIDNEPSDIIVICPYHDGHLLTLTAEGRVCVYDQRRWKHHRLGPFEW